MKTIHYIKAALVAALLISLTWFVLDWQEKTRLVKSQANQITSLEDYVKVINTDLNGERKKNSIYVEAALKSEQSSQLAEQKRLDVIKNMSNQLEYLRGQVIPKTCNEAISWAILHKGELSWKKP